MCHILPERRGLVNLYNICLCDQIWLVEQFPVDDPFHLFMLTLNLFSVSLLHSLIKWLTVSFLSQVSCVLLIFTLIWLTCAVFKRDLVSLFRFSLRSHVNIISCATLFVYHFEYSENCFSSHLCFLDFCYISYPRTLMVMSHSS